MAFKIGSSDISSKLIAELKSLASMMLYFAGWLIPLLIIKNLLLEEYTVSMTHISAGMVGALILSKVVLILEHVPFGAWVSRQPAWVDVFLRTLLYGAGVVVVLLLEKGFEGRHEMGGFWRALATVLAHPDINHVWVNTICVTAALFSYNLLVVLRRHLNDQTVLGLLAKPLPEKQNIH